MGRFCLVAVNAHFLHTIFLVLFRRNYLTLQRKTAKMRKIKKVDIPQKIKDIENFLDKKCGFRVFYVLKIVWAVGFVVSVAGLFIWNDANYRRTFFYILLPLILYGVIIIINDWIKEDKSK